MKLQINGETQELADASNIDEVVAALKLPPAAVLVEHDGTALRRSEWPERKVAEGDRLEIIRIVAGG